MWEKKTRKTKREQGGRTKKEIRRRRFSLVKGGGGWRPRTPARWIGISPSRCQEGTKEEKKVGGGPALTLKHFLRKTTPPSRNLRTKGGSAKSQRHSCGSSRTVVSDSLCRETWITPQPRHKSTKETAGPVEKTRNWRRDGVPSEHYWSQTVG